jgi:hypothetical protein
MGKIKIAEHCCQGGDRVIDTEKFSEQDLILSVDGKKKLKFSPLGNNPQNPKIALVGITPGSQSDVFAKNLRSMPVGQAAKEAAFEKGQSQIKELLNSQGFATKLGINLEGNLNDNPDIFTTSLVKCCLMVDGDYKYKAPDIVASHEAGFCVTNRFLKDIEKFSTLKWIIIFGDPGWEAINTLKHKDISIYEHLCRMGIKVLKFPHFAQNFQQRAIFCNTPNKDKEYFLAKPKHKAYAPKAIDMRSALVRAIDGLESM